MISNNEIQVFNFSNSEMRTITTPTGEVYFVASDVCKALDLTNVGQALSRLDDDEKTYIISNDVSMGTPKLTIVNESGLYSLVLSSRKPEAKAFKKWVTSEVLPAIRKTGKYEATVSLTPAELLLQSAQRLVDMERAQAETNARLAKVEARLQTHNEDYYSLAGYYVVRSWRWDLTKAESQKAGKELTRLSGVMGYEVHKVHDTRFGEVGAYHQDVLAKYFDSVRGKQ